LSLLFSIRGSGINVAHQLGGGRMRRTVLVLTGVAVAATSISQTIAATRITADRGGLLTDYVERFEAARATGERVIIDGPCFSACTIAIALLRRGQVCATPKAVLGFHAAWRPTANGGRRTSEAATEALYEAYPSNVRRWIDRHGGLSGRIILLKGRELAQMVPVCAIPPTFVAGSISRKQLARTALAAQQNR
jgi:hypothetical protein